MSMIYNYCTFVKFEFMNVLFKMMIMYYYYYYTRLTRVWTLNGKTKKKKEMGILVFPYSLEPNDVKLQTEGRL